MKSVSQFAMLPIAALVAATFTLSAHASEAWVGTNTKAHNVGSATHIAATQSGEPIQVVVALQLRNKSSLDALTKQILSGAAVTPLTPQQFKSQYAPTGDQVQAVVNYLSQHGFKNINVASNNLLITADGTAGSVKEAFQAELHTYNVNGRIAHANTTDAQVPQSLSGIISAVHGLQDVDLMHTHARRLTSVDGSTTKTAGAVAAISIPNFPAIYNASGLPSASNATIGIITEGSMTQTLTDLKSFAASAGYPVPPVTVVTVGAASTDTSGVDEWNMDSQTSLAASGGTIKSMLLYTANSMTDAALTLAYNQAVTDNKARVINVSLGECETSAKSAGTETTDDAIFQTAVAQGQTFSVSAGDSGSYECGGKTSYQSYPAVSPYVMALGGTTLSTTGGNTWAGETVWSCTSASNCSSSGGTGGGPSTTEAAPSWQTAAKVLGTSTKRGVPDIAFDASPNSGALVLINGSNVQIGGTSLAAPLFTGFFSRIQSGYGNTLAFPASKIYSGAAANPGWFHDVTSGSNGGYSAAAGWDYTTGYGSLNVTNFYNSY